LKWNPVGYLLATGATAAERATRRSICCRFASRAAELVLRDVTVLRLVQLSGLPVCIAT
jgi:hypothetical protein